jgi:opacity protein-like surface antigen
MKRLAFAAGALAMALPALAQSPEMPPPSAPAHAVTKRWFVGGGFGATFGTVDSIMVAPMIGMHVVPRVDVGTQLYYRWSKDGRFSPSLSTNDYGLTLFTRVRVVFHLFLEADYEYTNYEYATGVGTTTRSTYNTFLAGGGYAVPLGHGASFYVSALYDFGYDSNDPFRPYDNPWRIQVGAAIGF